MVSNTRDIRSCPDPAGAKHPWNEPLLKLGLISQPLTGSNTGCLFLALVRRFRFRYEHRPFSSGDGISCFSFPGALQARIPGGPSTPFDSAR